MKLNRNLIIFLASQFIALIGERISSIAFISLASQMNPIESSTSASLIGAFQIIPIIIFSFLGGYFADKFSRKWILLIFNSIRIVIILFTIFLFRIGNSSILVVYLAVLILGLVTALYNPTKKSFIPFLVDSRAESIKKGNWYLTISEVIAMLLGVGIGTLLLNIVAPQKLLIFDAIFFIVSISLLFFLSIKKKDSVAPGKIFFIKEFRESIKIIRTNKPVMGLMLFLVLPFYISSGLFYAAASHWAAVVSPQNTGEALGRLLLVLATGAISSYGIKKYFDKWDDYTSIKILFLANSISILSLIFFTTNDQFMTYIFTFITGLFVGLLYPRTIYLFQLLVNKTDIGKITSLNEIIFAVSFVCVILSSVLLGDIFTYKIGWLANSIFLFITFIAIHFAKEKFFVKKG